MMKIDMDEKTGRTIITKDDGTVLDSLDPGHKAEIQRILDNLAATGKGLSYDERVENIKTELQAILLEKAKAGGPRPSGFLGQVLTLFTEKTARIVVD